MDEPNRPAEDSDNQRNVYNDADDVFAKIDDRLHLTKHLADGRLYKAISGIAQHMSRNIVTSSLSSLSSLSPEVADVASRDIPEEEKEDDYDDKDEEEEEDEEPAKHCRSILEDWEPETSESGSYIVECSENSWQATSSRHTDCDDNDDGYSILPGCDSETATKPSNQRATKRKDDKNKMAAERLISLLLGDESFSSVQSVPSKTNFESRDRIYMKESKVKDDESKANLERWNLRLDRLLRRLTSTNKKIVGQLFKSKDSFSFDEFNFSDDEDDVDDVIIKPAEFVEFNRGLICTNVDQARDILTTRYKLSDVNKKRSIISWSKWNVSHIVRGPHTQSPIWKPGFIEEMEKSKNLMEELNKSIDAREANLQRLAENQTMDYYMGMALRCFERQQSNPDLQRNNDFLTLDSKKISPENVETKIKTNQVNKKSDIRSNSLLNIPFSPHQPQQSDHIKCFTLKDLNSNATNLNTSKPSIMDFFKQTNKNDDLDRPKFQSTSSKISDEGYDDDVFYREDEVQLQSKSHPLLNYFHNTTSLQAISQHHRNKMNKRSQQRRRQIKKKLEISFPKETSNKKVSNSQQSTPTQKAKTIKQTFNCMSKPGEAKFNSLRIIRRPPPSQSDQRTFVPLKSKPIRIDGATNVFTKFYHWFHGKVAGKEF